MKKLLILTTILLAALLSSCKDSNTANTNRVNIRMTDSPGAYDAIFLSVKEVRVLTPHGESTMQVDADFDILKFRMGKDTLLASQDIPGGKIDEVRIVLNDIGNKVVIDGIPYNLTTPSAHSSGLKLKINEELTDGLEYTLKLDFGAAKSIVRTGNNKYILKPVIRVIPQSVSGALSGVISPAESNAKVYAIYGTDTVGAVADGSGKFFLPGLHPRIYKVEVEPQSPYQSKVIESVTVETGSVKDLGTITVSQQ